MTLRIAATAQPLARPPRVRIDVTSDPGDQSLFDPLVTLGGANLDIVRQHADGSRYYVLVESGARLAGGAWSGFDMHAPLNTPVRYEALAAGIWTGLSPNRRVPSPRSWLVHPSNPGISIPILRITELAQQKRAGRSGLFQVQNAPRAVSVSAGFREAMESSITISVRTEDAPAVWNLLSDDSAVLINTVAAPGFDVKWEWVQPDEVTMENKANATFYPYRSFNFSYTVVDPPDIDTVSAWDYRALSVAYVDYSTIASTYGDYAAIATNDRNG